MDLQIPVWVPASFHFFGDLYPEVELLDYSMFNILRSCHAVFCSSTVLHRHQQSTRVPVSPHLCQHLLLCFFLFLVIGILLGVMWLSYCGFDLHFLNDWWRWASFHIFIGCLYIFFGKMSLQVFCPFLYQGFGLLLLSYRSYLCILVHIKIWRVSISKAKED